MHQVYFFFEINDTPKLASQECVDHKNRHIRRFLDEYIRYICRKHAYACPLGCMHDTCDFANGVRGASIIIADDHHKPYICKDSVPKAASYPALPCFALDTLRLATIGSCLCPAKVSSAAAFRQPPEPWTYLHIYQVSGCCRHGKNWSRR